MPSINQRQRSEFCRKPIFSVAIYAKLVLQPGTPSCTPSWQAERIDCHINHVYHNAALLSQNMFALIFFIAGSIFITEQIAPGYAKVGAMFWLIVSSYHNTRNITALCNNDDD
jgi:hypothetical protein